MPAVLRFWMTFVFLKISGCIMIERKWSRGYSLFCFYCFQGVFARGRHHRYSFLTSRWRQFIFSCHSFLVSYVCVLGQMPLKRYLFSSSSISDRSSYRFDTDVVSGGPNQNSSRVLRLQICRFLWSRGMRANILPTKASERTRKKYFSRAKKSCNWVGGCTWVIPKPNWKP